MMNSEENNHMYMVILSLKIIKTTKDISRILISIGKKLHVIDGDNLSFKLSLPTVVTINYVNIFSTLREIILASLF